MPSFLEIVPNFLTHFITSTLTHPLSCFLINSVFVFDAGCFVILHLFEAAEEIVWRVKAYTDECSETVSGTC